MFRLSVVFFVFFLSGCGFNECDVSNAHKNPPSDFQWYRTPLLAVLHDLGNDFQETSSQVLIEQNVGGESIESPNSASVFLEETTPMDDSVAAIHYTYRLSKMDGKWKVDSRSQSQKCKAGRGHSDFSKQKCH